MHAGAAADLTVCSGRYFQLYNGELRDLRKFLQKLDIFPCVGYKYIRCAEGQPTADIEKSR